MTDLAVFNQDLVAIEKSGKFAYRFLQWLRSVIDKLNNADSVAATAEADAQTGITNAAAAQTTANTAVTNAAAAQSTADTAVTNAATAQSTANTALSVANAALPASGIVNGSNAAAGKIGEVLSAATAASTSITGWTSNTAKNIISVTLTPGDWDVIANGDFEASAITGTGTLFGISLSTGAFDAGFQFYETPSVPSANASVYGTMYRRINVTTSTTVFLVGRIIFTGGTPAAGGQLVARRAR